ncbi:MAG TPA: molybdate ABC transporter permease subunit, partial [Microbacterium sp.]|nr:molybdate ABC transporter permease subunit [Microbacterium sp.]
MTLPRGLYIPAVAAVALLVLPIVGLLSRVRWDGLGEDLLSASALNALGLSLATAACATVLCLLLGGPLAIVIARAPR